MLVRMVLNAHSQSPLLLLFLLPPPSSYFATALLISHFSLLVLRAFPLLSAFFMQASENPLPGISGY